MTVTECETLYNVVSAQVGLTDIEHDIFCELLILPVYFPKKHVLVPQHVLA